jgi:tRNA-dihydrouridine synthase
VIGNGDVTTPEAAKHMLDETGCAGVSIGRGAFYNPWIFTHTQHYLQTGHLHTEPGYAERVHVLRRHLDLMIEIFGEEHGCRLFRKPAAWYAKRFGPAKEFKRGITQFGSRAEFEALLVSYEKWRAPFLDARGELLAKYRPDPMVASFMRDEDEPAVMRRDSIPVPKGPVDVW